MRSYIHAAVGILAGLSVHSMTARGQNEAKSSEPDAEASLKLDDSAAWTVLIEPMVWAPALRGDIELPGGGPIDVESIGADENEVVPAGRATIRAERWTFQFRGFGFGLDESEGAGAGFTLDGAAIAPGTAVDTELDLSSFDLTGAYEIYVPVNDPARDVRLAFDLSFGARLTSVETEVTAGGSASRGDNVWAMPIGGARMRLDLPHGFGLNLAGDIGGFPGDDEAFTWDITVAFSWRFHENIGLEIGFRHLDSNLSEGEGAGEYTFDASLAGLFGALVIRF